MDEDKSERGDAESCAQSVLEQTEQSVISSRTVVVSRDGEHTLVDAHVYHDEYECHLVGDAVSAHCHVAAVLLQSGIDEYHDDAGAHVHGERRHSYGEDVLHNLCFRTVDAASEVHYLILVAEESALPSQRH